MKIPFVSKDTGEKLFVLEIPFMEWRACKKAAREDGMTLDDWFEKVIRRGIEMTEEI